MNEACVVAGIRRQFDGTRGIAVSMSARARTTLRASFAISDASWRPTLGQEIAWWADDTVIGAAREVNGTSSVLSRAFTSGTVDNWTVGAWCYVTATGAQQMLMLVGTASNGYGIYVTATGYWQGVLSGVTVVGGTAAAVVTNTWTHVCLRRSGGTTQLFVNGVAAGSTTASAPSAPNGYIAVGARRNAGNTAFEQFTGGRLAHAFLAHTALTDAQIGQIAAGGPAGTSRTVDAVITGTYWYYPIRGDASPEPDTAASTSLNVTSATQTLDGPLVVSATADVQFAGEIDSVSEGGLGGFGASALLIAIGASDFNSYSDRINRAGVAIPSETVADRLATIVANVPLFTGLTVAADQPTGPTLVAREVSYQRMTEFFDQLREESEGYVPRINEFKEISMRLPSTVAAPWNVDTTSGPSDLVSDVRVKTSLVSGYCNLLRTYFGTGTRSFTDVFQGNGSTNPFPLSREFGSITVGTVLVNLVTHETLSINTAGGQWVLDTTVRPATLTRAAGPLAGGNTARLTYTALYPFAGPTFVDAGAIGSIGVYESFLTLPDTFDVDEVTTVGSARFTTASVMPKTLTYTTYRAGLRPGQIQHITVPTRGTSPGLDHDCVITSVEVSTVGNVLKYRVTASTGPVVDDWRTAWTQMAS